MTHREEMESLVRGVAGCVTERTRAGGCSPSQPAFPMDAERVHRLKVEMVRVGRKLWDREYVDGNGGNLSVRLSDQLVLCTPTMMSKGDVAAEDLCLCDMAGNVVAGAHRRSSELLLHLEIYKANAKAQAVVHCHPPHATAFAAIGVAPPCGVLTEQEIFVGPVAMAPYETPGTQAFAETVLPFVHRHNTILLRNHGIVCWSDTLTHAEWLVEIVDTYCRTIILAKQMGEPLCYIPREKIEEILDIKRRMGFPDPRIAADDASDPSMDRDAMDRDASDAIYHFPSDREEALLRSEAESFASEELARLG